MMNVDGVFLGNYRTGIVGKDFNRMFSTTKSNLFPEIEAVRNLIQKLKESGKVLCFIDLHGHSILRNSFIFGSSKTPNDNRCKYSLIQLANSKTNSLKTPSILGNNPADLRMIVKKCRLQECIVKTNKTFFHSLYKILWGSTKILTTPIQCDQQTGNLLETLWENLFLTFI